jgi:CheY-like chemotaxis protein
MVVDDTPTVVVYLSVLLKRMGFDVVSARDGQEAMGLIQDRHPDVVLLDLQMPVMDGLTFLERLSARVPMDRPPVVVVTASSDPHVLARCRELGARAVLQKPVGLKALHMEVEACLEPLGVKRRHLRARFGQPVTVTYAGEPHLHHAVTLSEGGIYVRMVDPLPRGSLVTVALPAPDGQEIAMVGRVIYDRGVYGGDSSLDPGVAIEFEQVDEQQRLPVSILVRRLLLANLFEGPDQPVIGTRDDA